MSKAWTKPISGQFVEAGVGGEMPGPWLAADSVKAGYALQGSAVGLNSRTLATALLVGGATLSSAHPAPEFFNPNVATTTFFAGAPRSSPSNASITELRAPHVYKDMGGEIARMRHDLVAVNKAVRALSAQTAAMQATLANVVQQEHFDDTATYSVDALEKALASFNPLIAGDFEADALDQAAEAGLRSPIITQAACAGLEAVDSLVRAAAARALAVSNAEMAIGLLPARIETEKNGTVRLILASALRTALLG